MLEKLLLNIENSYKSKNTNFFDLHNNKKLLEDLPVSYYY